LFLLLSGLLYGYCWWKGEKGIEAKNPEIVSAADEEDTRTQEFEMY